MKLPQNPIFIVGYPRSGTTFMQRILAAQPGLYTFPETHYFCVIEKSILWDRESRENIPPSALAAVFENIAQKMEFRFTIEEQDTLYRQAGNRSLSSKVLFEYIVSRYLMNLYPDIKNISRYRWVEKTPNHANFLHRIIALYPDAQVLHILRHPVPAIYSRKMKFPFNKETPVIQLARNWNRMLLNVERFKNEHPGCVLTLRYEDLIQEMEKQICSVAAFLNVPIQMKNIQPSTPLDAGSFILPSETWKLEDLQLDIAVTNNRYQNLLSSADIMEIENITLANMRQYDYESFRKEIT